MVYSLSFCGLPSKDQGITIQAGASKNEITIGDVIDYTVKITCPENLNIQLPEKPAALGDWEVRDAKISTGIAQTPDKVLNIDYSLVTFSTGLVTIPEIAFKYDNGKTQRGEFKTQSCGVTVKSMLEKYGVAQGDIRDIKPPARFKPRLSDYLPWIIGLLLALTVFAIWYRMYQNRKRALMPEPEKPKIPPHIIALEELEKLKNSGLVKEGRIKEYYISLADIIRNYVSGIYSIETRDRTTNEVYADMKKKVADKKLLGMYKDFFDECDFVKFARYRPDEETCSDDLEMAVQIVEMRHS
jgi:hypothetical protein